MSTSLSKLHSAQTHLLDAHIVDIEVDLSRGLHAFSIVGLPDKAVEEAKDRVSAAIKHSGFASPKTKNQKIVVSLAPADLKKEGPSFDLGIALGYLLASGEINFNTKDKIFLGELALDGSLRKIKGILPLVKHAKEKGFKEVYLPKENAVEGALISGIKIFGISNLKEIISHLIGEKILQPSPETKIETETEEGFTDLSDIKGQESAKRGLLIAAAGGHNIALFGPAGTGKTMLARALCDILPPLSFEEALEVTSIYSIAGLLQKEIMIRPPFRSPHHTSSYVSIVGGGAIPKPGEVTLAHRGVLFVDEFPEFERRVIDSLRQPLEDRVVSISRSKGSAVFPGSFILVAALNPCPCGNFGSQKECVCSPKDISRYQKKLSGPIVDRIDIWIEMPLLKHEILGEKRGKSENERARELIKKAREIQKNRLKKSKRKISLNSEMNSREIEEEIFLSDDLRKILNQSAEKLNLSPRSYHKVIKLSRTIADLEESEEIKKEHLLEALQYRQRGMN